MKNQPCLVVAVCAAVFIPTARAADEKPAVKEEKREMRVLAAPDREHRVFMRRDSDKIEKETVAFLGVEAAPVSPALGSQLALARGTGLVVEHVVPKSPAAAVLQEHDVLLKLDDQILIETRQLSVLIRGHKEGDAVVVTYLRAGQKATATIKLGQHEVPKMSWAPGANVRAWGGVMGGTDGRFDVFAAGPEGDREHVDRVLGLIGRTRGGPDVPPGAVPPPVRVQIDHGSGSGFRAMSVNTGNSSIVFSDEAGSLELTTSQGVKSLIAKNPAGETVFSGPVTTPEERKAAPAEVRARLEKLEGMRDVTFHADGDFQGAETRVLRPRGIAFPRPEPAGAPVPPGVY
jgi:hypothetical protein